jgi:hypothetical protein
MGEPFEDVKKTLDEELKRLAAKEQDDAKDVDKLLKEADDLEKKTKPSSDEKKRLGEIRKTLQTILNSCQADAKGSCNRINQVLKTKVPDDEKSIPIWQKGMEKWYRDRIDKEPGFDLGHGIKLKGDMSIKDKQATLSVSGHF